MTRRRAALTWQSFESWVGSRASIVTLFVVALAAFALQSLAVPVGPGRDMGRYVQAFIQLGYAEPDPHLGRGHAWAARVARGRSPARARRHGRRDLAGIPLRRVDRRVERRRDATRPSRCVLTAALLLVNPSYAILFHQLASDSLFAAAFAGWAVLLSTSDRSADDRDVRGRRARDGRHSFSCALRIRS